ncbi:MAG: PD40 domain-containing protein [Ignavibacterium album]|jgi:Tol biopolymer transport system component|uniref:TolB family protein n=1 Tax=Ignavibacterium album TaxID=591197 RepID=UPI0026ED61FF|nr:DPP IV N-terminal domain-containing protein [Ignavibacterium album]MBI5662391.1 PD40 domain-containing protein [Ignavibacterium album]
MKNINHLLIILIFIISKGCNQSTEPNNDETNLIAMSQTGPKFSSDGQKIVFEGLYDSVYAVHFINISGNYLGYILDKKGFLSSPTWSPNDEKIAVTIEGNLYTVKVNGDSLTMLTNTGEDFFSNWSPDGRYIAYTKSICDPECGIMLYEFSNGSATIKAQYGSYASWSSDSKRVYYRNNFYITDPETQRGDYKGFIFKRINVITLEEDSLFYVKSSDGGLYLHNCTVSPDEEEILFAASYGSPPQINIWKIILQTGKIIQITHDGGSYPSYDPTGDKIVYTNTNVNEGGIWIMNRDGSNKQRLTKLKR